ncbi:hypothetical protein KIPB_005032 [Kipferlia bialata]|uniref:Uncharacterized protein n=1 Tax=Kipferlia bialata TaxID=797122 RepID=A0A9K3CW09_9EUKA|nr:hypothetical protein KIPB_005032 [Kipferlia bialata]|eukprot:g5032.t1
MTHKLPLFFEHSTVTTELSPWVDGADVGHNTAFYYSYQEDVARTFHLSEEGSMSDSAVAQFSDTLS